LLFSLTSGLPSQAPPRTCHLASDSWDDWYKFQTTFYLVVFDEEGIRREIGSVKIGQFGLLPAPRDQAGPGKRAPEVPPEFDALDERFFSLGQSEDYYAALSPLSRGFREEILRGMRDCAFNLDLFLSASTEDVMNESLLRSVSAQNVKGRLHRLSKGDAQLTPYNFSFSLSSSQSNSAGPTLSFNVQPESFPPTNLHVLIGPNGVGKTTSLGRVTHTVMTTPPNESDDIARSFDPGTEDAWEFASLVSVAFSAFDPFLPIRDGAHGQNGIRYAYVGLKKLDDESIVPLAPKSEFDLAHEFASSSEACWSGPKFDRWLRAISMLQGDPLFEEADIGAVGLSKLPSPERRQMAFDRFSTLSAGHKVVLLTMTRLVELVDERSLVLIDEPEAHLHPPLLAAFLRALSDLLIQRNGVAIIATHSPVVLQEVPKSCVWRLWRSGAEVGAERPTLETFGENVGILTREVFGLEVVRTGFHKMLSDVVDDDAVTYEDVLWRFRNQLGAEARSIARALVATRQERTESTADPD
jgi:hypothetical protein